MIRPLLQDEAFLADLASVAPNEPRLHVWWLGQSGFLVQHLDQRVLFDPYLSDSLTKKYAGTDRPHVRMTERCVAPARLTGITLITSSHLHTDHFDVETLGPLFAANPAAHFVFPEANRNEVERRLGVRMPAHSTGLNDGMRAHLGDGKVFIQAVVAAHNEVERDDAGRSRFLGFIVELGAFRIYHSGDTLWHDDIVRDLREVPCDLAFLPINGNRPERRVAGNLDGLEAAALAKAGHAGLAVPHHFEMFEFNTAPPDEFSEMCVRLRQPHRVLRCGERLTLQSPG